MYNREDFPDYGTMFTQFDQLTPYLVKAKEQTEDMAKALAERHKETPYHMVVGSGVVWGEAYDYAMCILEEDVYKRQARSRRARGALDAALRGRRPRRPAWDRRADGRRDDPPAPAHGKFRISVSQHKKYLPTGQ